jgi:hypothetical protein
MSVTGRFLLSPERFLQAPSDLTHRANWLAWNKKFWHDIRFLRNDSASSLATRSGSMSMAPERKESSVCQYPGAILMSTSPRERLLVKLQSLPGLPTIHSAMDCVLSNSYGFNPMRPQVQEVHQGSRGCIHDDRASCRRGIVSPRNGQRLASGILISSRCAG